MTRRETLVGSWLLGFCLSAWPAVGLAQEEDHTDHSAHEAHPADGAAQESAASSSNQETHDHAAHTGGAAESPPGLPPLTDADRTAAFPDVEPHAMLDNVINYFVLFDQLEWRSASGGGASWDTTGWIGHDLDRFWFRTEGEVEDGELEHGEAHLLYGRAFARWWDVVVGVRQDLHPGLVRTWAAIGLQGLAPYWFEVQVTAYVGPSGRTQARLEAEYELLLTNRLVLQPVVEVNLYGRSDLERTIGAGLGTAEGGLRLRYEVRREFGPYVGVSWTQRFGQTANFARAAGDAVSSPRIVSGLRLWF